MVGIGILLMIVGFAFVVPRGAVPGSVAARNIRLSPGQLSRTSGYQDAPAGRARLIRLLVGAVLLAGGLLLIIAAS